MYFWIKEMILEGRSQVQEGIVSKENGKPQVNINSDYVFLSVIQFVELKMIEQKCQIRIACNLEGRLSEFKYSKSPCIINGEGIDID